MEIIDEIETQKTKNKSKDKRTMGTEAVMKGGELNNFLVHLSFLKLICKSCLIFNSNLELALSVILKQRELYESKHVVLECKCLKI